MHIALLIPTVDRMGGAERQVLLLAQGLRRRGHRVTVVALSGDGGAAGRALVAESIEFLSLAMRKGLADPRGWWMLHCWLRSERPDVVHAHLSHAAWMARWSRLFIPQQIVVDTIHTSATGTLGRRLGYRLSDWLADAVTAVSRAAADAHIEAGMATTKHLTVVPNGIALDAWIRDEDARRKMRLELGANDEFVWLAAGRLEPVKDYATLMRAFARLGGTTRLLIAGDGAQEPTLRRMAKNLNLEARVRFLGFQTELLRWMQAADGFVSASLWEGLPMAVLEAAACELPSVATDVPGNGEAVRNGATGLLTVKGDADALATTMAQLMRLPECERRAMGNTARRMVEESYGLEHVLDQWETLYRGLILRADASGRLRRRDRTQRNTA